MVDRDGLLDAAGAGAVAARGVLCDYGGHKKRYLAAATITCALATAALYFAAPGEVWLAIALLTASNCAYMIGEAFCGSFLTDLATKKTMG